VIIILAPNSIVRQSPNIVSRNIAGEVILVPIARNADELESIYTLNETASTIWDALDGQRTLADLVGLVVAEYDVTDDVALEDLFELVEQLAQVRAVEIVAA
jgi:predicted RND superfamily exporter protein